MNKKYKKLDSLLFIGVCALLIVYIGIFTYLNMCKYEQHVDSDIAVDAILAREIWIEKDFTPSNWISSTERLVIGVPSLASLFYGMSGSMVFSMGLACAIVGVLLLAAIGFTLRRSKISYLGIATALLALCALPINGLRNQDQMVPFVTLLWFLFADYYALHSICLFLSIAFYMYLRINLPDGFSKKWNIFLTWFILVAFCGALALGGMRCLQVVALPLAVWEIVLLFNESKRFAAALPKKRWVASLFVFCLLLVAGLAKLYPTSVEYPMYMQNGKGMINRLFLEVPAAVLECLGIAGNCKLTSLDAIMQLGMIAVLCLAIYGLFFIYNKKNDVGVEQQTLISALGASFLLTVFIEVVTNAETAHNYFFVVWFVIISVIAALITNFQKIAPIFGRLIVVCVCGFALLNIFYTYKDCITTTDNLAEYEEVIEYMQAEDIDYGYAEFWDASRITIMTDGDITMGHSYQMEDLCMYWWTTSMKWYVPNLPVEMKTAYVVKSTDKEGFLAQFEDPSVMTLRFENGRFAVYVSDYNFVGMQ